MQFNEITKIYNLKTGEIKLFSGQIAALGFIGKNKNWAMKR